MEGDVIVVGDMLTRQMIYSMASVRLEMHHVQFKLPLSELQPDFSQAGC